MIFNVGERILLHTPVTTQNTKPSTNGVNTPTTINSMSINVQARMSTMPEVTTSCDREGNKNFKFDRLSP